jgi:hypothetical protein
LKAQHLRRQLSQINVGGQGLSPDLAGSTISELPIQNAEASKTGRIGRKLREWLLEDLQALRRYEPDEFKKIVDDHLNAKLIVAAPNEGCVELGVARVGTLEAERKRHQVPAAGKMWKTDHIILKRTILRSPMTVLAHSLATRRQKYLV